MPYAQHVYVLIFLGLAGSAVFVGGAVMFFRARRRWKLSLEAERDQLDAIFESSPTGMVVLNDRLDIVRLNSAAACMAKGEPSKLVNQRQGAFLKCAHRAQDIRGCGYGADCAICQLRKVIEPAIAAGNAVRNAEVEMVLAHEGNVQTVWLRVGAQPFKLYGRRQMVVAIEDITDYKKNLELLRGTREELTQLNEETQCANEMKGQFLANTSHEIRTPLNGIIGMTGLLMGTAMTSEQREFAETIRTSGEALLVVVNDILDFSKIEANKIVLEDESFDLQHCVDEAVRLVAQAATKKKLELICQYDESLESVWIGDVGRLRQVLVNLLNNAIKFTERGEVVVSVTGQQRDTGQCQLDFAVRDTGVGIPPAQQKKLFKAFSQVDASTSRRFSGTGLGLVISKRLCELMGGEMSVESKGIPGQGSTFRFSIIVKRDTGTKPAAQKMPHGVLEGKRVLIVDDNASSRGLLQRQTEAWKMVATAVSAGKAALDCLDEGKTFDLAVLDSTMPSMNGLKLVDEIRSRPGLEKLPMVLLSPMGDQVAGGVRVRVDACLSKPALASRLHQAFVNLFVEQLGSPGGNDNLMQMPLDGTLPNRNPLKILLAEDNFVNQKVAVSLLSKLGYQADVVADGKEAVEAVKRIPYDVVLMDILMPEMDGEEAACRIRNEVPIERQPWIVAMTANVMKGDRERYLLNGMNDYIPKPVRIEFLLEVLRSVQPLAARAAQAKPGTTPARTEKGTGS